MIEGFVDALAIQDNFEGFMGIVSALF